MQYESFQIQFNWYSNTRQLQIRTPIMEYPEPEISLYQVFRDETYLFSIVPAINHDASKVWEIVEKERESHLPPGFITVLGDMIDHFYTCS